MPITTYAGQAGKDRLRARIGDAQLAASAAPEAAPAVSAAAAGSALESGMASGVAAGADAEHVDDAGTPQRPAPTPVCTPKELFSSIPSHALCIASASISSIWWPESTFNSEHNFQQRGI